MEGFPLLQYNIPDKAVADNDIGHCFPEEMVSFNISCKINSWVFLHQLECCLYGGSTLRLFLANVYETHCRVFGSKDIFGIYAPEYGILEKYFGLAVGIQPDIKNYRIPVIHAGKDCGKGRSQDTRYEFNRI